MVEFSFVLPAFSDSPHGMQDGGVIAATEKFSNFGQGLLSQFFGQIHGDLSCERNVRGAPLGIHISDFELVIVSNCFLDVFDRDRRSI